MHLLAALAIKHDVLSRSESTREIGRRWQDLLTEFHKTYPLPDLASCRSTLQQKVVKYGKAVADRRRNPETGRGGGRDEAENAFLEVACDSGETGSCLI